MPEVLFARDRFHGYRSGTIRPAVRAILSGCVEVDHSELKAEL
jgi:hypothetical protein